jgi:hypothetical protein
MTDQHGAASQPQPQPSTQPDPQPTTVAPAGQPPYAEPAPQASYPQQSAPQASYPQQPAQPASYPPGDQGAAQPYQYGDQGAVPTYPGAEPLPYGVAGQPAQRGSRAKLAAIAGAGLLALFVLVLGGLAVWDGLREDSGITACRSLADLSTGQPRPELSQDEYREQRDQFADSDIRALRENGTGMMDLVWEVSQQPNGEANALRYLPQLSVRLEALQRACADQGVTISPELPD